MMGKMRESEECKGDQERVEALYHRYKAAGKKNCLLKAAFGGFTGSICWQAVGGITAALLNFLSPFIILKLINYIEDGVKD